MPARPNNFRFGEHSKKVLASETRVNLVRVHSAIRRTCWEMDLRLNLASEHWDETRAAPLSDSFRGAENGGAARVARLDTPLGSVAGAGPHFSGTRRDHRTTNCELPSLRFQVSVRIQRRSARAPLTGQASRNGCRPRVIRRAGGYEDGFLLVVAGRGSAASAICARCHAASRSRRSRATSTLAVSRIASA